jgi:hypothetical protein
VSLPPAHCVISLANGTDPACMVHTHYAPCPRDGEPANPGVMHTDMTPSRAEAIEHWRRRTHGQRTLVIHVGRLGEEHDIGVNAVDCWCGPEVIWAQFGEPAKGVA